jgi:hypothetical protein
MTSATTQFMNPPLYQHRKRVVLKRSTHQINDPVVIKQKFNNLNTPNKKSVQFHEQLEHVRYFYKTQSPVTVKNDPPFMDTSADDYKLTQPNWPSRNTIFYQSDNKIRMESVQLVDGDYDQMVNNTFAIQGRCRAANLSFHKVVSIRYTFDLWRTYQETTGVFKESIASTSNTWDRFSFSIPVQAKQSAQSLYLALRYTVDDQEHWDNNNGMNYEVVITPNTENKTTTSASAAASAAAAAAASAAAVIEQVPTAITSDIKPELALKKKDMSRRYDFSASLTAARKPVSPPPSPPSTPVETEEIFNYTPPVFFNASPVTYEKKPIDHSPPPSPTMSADGFQMSYSDFVNKYCFYNSHSNPIYSTLSTSPSAVLS